MIRITNALLELLNRGSMKRLCFFTSSAASINSTRKTSDYGYAMSMAARNMGITILYNKLVSEGYTFRVCSREINVTNSSVDLEAYKVDASSALAYFLRDRYVDRHNASRCDEHRLVIRDQQGRECPW